MSEQVEAAVRVGKHRSLLARVKQLLRGVERMLMAPFVRPEDCTYLFIAINGAGLGHLTRCLAVARRLKAQEPNANIVFFTTSVAVPIVVSFGFYAYHVPPAASLKDAGYSSADWNFVFARQLDVVLSLHRPGRVIFDGTYPYPGLQLAMMKYRRVRWVWIRRGSSRQTAVLAQAERFVRKFHLVLVPGEIGSSPGKLAEPMVLVPPVVLMEDADILDTEDARIALRLDLLRPAVYVQLGAGVINDIEGLQTKVISSLRAAIPGVQVVVGRSPIAISEQATDSDVTIVSYPNSRYFKAFDLAVLAAGYNSVAEAFTFRTPAIFFPNTSTGSDDQVHRASIVAELGGWRVMTGWNEAAFANHVGDLLTSGNGNVDLRYEDGAARSAELIREIR